MSDHDGLDEVITMRGMRKFGLFVSELGRDRAFLVYPAGRRELSFTSDLAGLNGALYESVRFAGSSSVPDDDPTVATERYSV